MVRGELKVDDDSVRRRVDCWLRQWSADLMNSFPFQAKN